MMKFCIGVIAITLTCVMYVCSCSGAMKKIDKQQDKLEQRVKASADRPPVIYPYHASEERAKIIYSNWAKIKENMKESAVVDILGKPDQILPLYEPQVKNSKQIGYSQWYLIQRLKEHGSVNEKGEKLVRISYDMHGIVTQVDHWGF